MESTNTVSFLDQALNNMLAAGYLQGLTRAHEEVAKHDVTLAAALERIIVTWRETNPEAAQLAQV